jgi:hypothetical protein
MLLPRELLPSLLLSDDELLPGPDPILRRDRLLRNDGLLGRRRALVEDLRLVGARLLLRHRVQLLPGAVRGVPHFHVCQLYLLTAPDCPLPFRERGRR